jgi:hypothetical protein
MEWGMCGARMGPPCDWMRWWRVGRSRSSGTPLPPLSNVHKVSETKDIGLDFGLSRVLPGRLNREVRLRAGLTYVSIKDIRCVKGARWSSVSFVLSGGWGRGAGVHAGAGVVEVSGGGLVGAGEGEAEAGHVGVDGLVVAGGDLEGLVPDADGAVGAYALVEGFPGGKVGGGAGLGVVDEVVEAAPVLGDHDAGPVDGGEAAEKAEVGVGVELPEHGAHGFGDGEPLVEGEEAVDAEADEEDDEGAFDAGGEAAWVEGGHGLCGSVQTWAMSFSGSCSGSSFARMPTSQNRDMGHPDSW